MRLQTRPFPNLLNADFIPYFWGPSIIISWYWFPYKFHPNAKIIGIQGHFWLFGFCVHYPNGGVHHNGSKWQILFKYNREHEEMI